MQRLMIQKGRSVAITTISSSRVLPHAFPVIIFAISAETPIQSWKGATRKKNTTHAINGHVFPPHQMTSVDTRAESGSGRNHKPQSQTPGPPCASVTLWLLWKQSDQRLCRQPRPFWQRLSIRFDRRCRTLPERHAASSFAHLPRNE